MKQYMKISAVFATVIIGMWIGAAVTFAHHLWVIEKDGAFSVCRGHIGESTAPYDPSCVTQISALAVDGTELPVIRKDEKTQAMFRAAEKPALAAVVSEWGDRVNTTRGKKLMSRKKAEAEGLTVISAFTSTQYSKTLLASSGVNSRPLGMKFELVPMVDPMMLAAGRPMNFKLLFDGQPLAGTSIFTNHNQEATSDANGVAKIVFEKSGLHLLYAIHKTPAEMDSGLDFLKFMTFLIFEVKE